MPVQSIGSKIEEILGDEAAGLLQHQCKTIPKDTLHLPGPDYVERIYSMSDRPTRVLTSLQALLAHGRLAGTGYVSILPVDQGIEHSAGASFAPNPMYFDPENIVKLAIEGGCNAVASTLGVLGSVARKYAHKIPFLVKLNHNEFLSYPNAYDQIKFGSVTQAFEMGAQAVGATIYFGSEESKRQIVEVTEWFQEAHELGMCTVLWCYLRNPAFKTKEQDYHVAADLTGQAHGQSRGERGRAPIGFLRDRGRRHRRGARRSVRPRASSARRCWPSGCSPSRSGSPPRATRARRSRWPPGSPPRRRWPRRSARRPACTGTTARSSPTRTGGRG